jgi:ATP-dependent helicase/nuclease subunit B
MRRMDRPNLFALPPGADFPQELVTGLLQHMAGQPPEALARVTLILNTQRMRRRVTECLTTSGARLLPRLLLVTEVAAALSPQPLPPATPALRRRLQLSVLLDRLLRTGSTPFPRAALYDLAESLAALMDEMQSEGVPPDRIAGLDVGNHSAHWARTQAFLGIVTQAVTGEGMDDAARQRTAILTLAAAWKVEPPSDPVIVAGSTGSRGTTALMMQAVAQLPNGAVVLPGFDFDLPDPVWAGMDDALTAEDHPQYRFRHLMELLGCDASAIRPWTTAPAPAPDRNRLISLSLRPAPVTDQWLADGKDLPDLLPATDGMTLLEAPGERTEALAIALILREAAEAGTSAALVTPDRNLARRVTATLDRWGIRPDDSAGRPLALTPPGRLLRQVAALCGQRLTIDALLAVLKHPLVFTGEGGPEGRGAHLILTREFELHARRHGPAFPTVESLAAWAEGTTFPAARTWAEILGMTLCGLQAATEEPLAEAVARHRAVVERLAQGFAAEGSGELWLKEAGRDAKAAMDGLEAEAVAGTDVTPADYGNLLRSVLAGEVRATETVHPLISIRGTLEARVQGSELVVLGGLNDGTWPALAAPDPWLNRAMRKAAGLLLPERQIGLSAHDYQQAVAAPRVVLSRSLRGAEAQTVPSRWLNRLVNLMAGLPARQGPEALAAMRARGDRWLALAAAFDAPPGLAKPAPRPSPRPAVEVRPKKLSVTEIKTLIRDPFAIYAKHFLRLRPLDPLRPKADPRLRGIVLHEILEAFVRQQGATVEDLLRLADQVLEKRVAWPLARMVWRARIGKAAEAFLAFSGATGGVPVLLEKSGAATLPGLDFTLTGKPDRIDRLADGRLLLIDYKTGTPPSKPEQKHFDKQLLLIAAMAENGAFAELGPQEVAKIVFVGLKADLQMVETVLQPGDVAEVWDEFTRLIASYARPSQGYTARRAMKALKDPSDYDHLSRLGEWDMTAKGSGQ